MFVLLRCPNIARIRCPLFTEAQTEDEFHHSVFVPEQRSPGSTGRCLSPEGRHACRLILTISLAR